MPGKGYKGTVYERIADDAVESKELWNLVHAKLAKQISWTEFMVKFGVIQANAEEKYFDERRHGDYFEEPSLDDEPWEHGGGAS
jgi:hypothetical protein